MLAGIQSQFFRIGCLEVWQIFAHQRSGNKRYIVSDLLVSYIQSFKQFFERHIEEVNFGFCTQCGRTLPEVLTFNSRPHAKIEYHIEPAIQGGGRDFHWRASIFSCLSSCSG